MARPKKITREKLLIAAESILERDGTNGLSFGAIAEESGMAKSSIQSEFGTRKKILDALLERWLETEKRRYDAILGRREGQIERAYAHVSATQAETSEAGIRTLTLLAAQAGQQSLSMTKWYLERMGNLEATNLDSKKIRIVYLATEGAFFMRNIVGFNLEENFWNEIFDDLRAFIDTLHRTV